jgi:glyoxylate carboligase
MDDIGRAFTWGFGIVCGAGAALGLFLFFVRLVKTMGVV